jgi:hypothetical protein
MIDHSPEVGSKIMLGSYQPDHLLVLMVDCNDRHQVGADGRQSGD